MGDEGWLCGNTSSKEWDISKGKRKKYVETWGNGKWKTKYERMKEKGEKEGKKKENKSWCKQNYGNISYNKRACDSRDTVGEVRLW